MTPSADMFKELDWLLLQNVLIIAGCVDIQGSK